MGDGRDDIPVTHGSGPSDPMRVEDQPGTWVEIDIDAPVEVVWALVSDIDLSARFSDEFLGAEWVDGERHVGASFVGRNRHPVAGEWEAPGFVEVWDEERSFAWATMDRENPGARWRFDLEPIGPRRTRLRYSMSLGPGPSLMTRLIETMPEQGPAIIRNRLAEHHANMARTVAGIAELAEAGAGRDP